MKDSGKLPKSLPPMELEFSLEVKGDITGKVYQGNFKYKIPNLKAKALAEKKRAELNGGMDAMLDASVLQLHFMIAYLRFSLYEVPQWWEDNDYGYNLYDYNVVKQVFDRVEQFETDYVKAVWGDQDGGRKRKEKD